MKILPLAFAAMAMAGAQLGFAGPGDLITGLTNPSASAGDQFGYAVQIYGKAILVGAPMSNGSGRVLEFTASGTYRRAYQPTNPGLGDRFGTSIANNGYTVAIGAPYHDAAGPDSGSVFVFNASSGQYVRTITCPSAQGGERFGSSVAVSGRNILIGAPGDDENGPDAGALYLFSTDGRLIRTLKAPSNEWYFFRGLGYQVGVSGRYFAGTSPAGDRFIYFDYYGNMVDRGSPSFSIAPYRSFFVVGAIDTAHPYARHAYKYNPLWRYAIQFYKDPTFDTEDNFGFSIAADQNYNSRTDRVVVGAPEESTLVSNQGAAFVFNNSSGAFQYLLANPSPQEGAQFGWSVAIGSPGVVVGAPFADVEGADSGAAYLFDKD